MKLNSYKPLLLALPLLSGCAFFSSKDSDLTYKYLKGEGVETAKPSEFEKVLSREMYMAGGNYHIVAFPYTSSYVKSLALEQASLKGLSAEETKKIQEFLEDKFTSERTCFNFRYSVLRFNQVAQLKDWRITLLDKKGDEYPLKWKKVDLEKSPVMTRVRQSGDHLEKWLGDGVACTEAQPILNSGFGLKVRPQYVQFPFDSYGDLYWEFPEIKMVDGQEVEVQTGKKRNFKTYRGW